MDKHRMISSPLVISVLSDEELRLLEKNYEFLYLLAYGGKNPDTNAQQHFVNVASGLELPETEYEILWDKYSKLLKADEVIEALNVNNSNLKIELADITKQLNKANNEIIDIKNKLNKKVVTLETDLETEKNKLNSIGICFSEQEINEIINVLGNHDTDCINLAKRLVDKIRSHYMEKNLSKSSLPESSNKEYEDPRICKACGSNSPYMCRCSD